MKKKTIIGVVTLAAIAVLLSYLLAIFRIDFKAVWALTFLVTAYFACVTTRKLFNPSIALLVLLGGIIITHIPWWISLHAKYDTGINIFIEYFFKGTKMSYSIAGIILGYLLYKLIFLRTKIQNN